MNQRDKIQVFDGRALHARKDAVRQKNQADFEAGVSADAIMRRNGCVSVESVRKARIIFA
jgi:hypothetical protein